MNSFGQKDVFEKYCTTPEMGKQLMRLGLSPETCDFVWHHWFENFDNDLFHSHLFKERKNGWELLPLQEPIDITVANCYHSFKDGYKVPAWSLGALLNLIPENAEKGEFNGEPYGWNINQDRLRYVNKGVLKDYSCSDGLVTAVYNLVCYLTENGYLPQHNYPKIFDFNTKQEYLIWDWPYKNEEK